MRQDGALTVALVIAPAATRGNHDRRDNCAQNDNGRRRNEDEAKGKHGRSLPDGQAESNRSRGRAHLETPNEGDQFPSPDEASLIRHLWLFKPIVPPVPAAIVAHHPARTMQQAIREYNRLTRRNGDVLLNLGIFPVERKAVAR